MCFHGRNDKLIGSKSANGAIIFCSIEGCTCFLPWMSDGLVSPTFGDMALLNDASTFPTGILLGKGCTFLFRWLSGALLRRCASIWNINLIRSGSVCFSNMPLIVACSILENPGGGGSLGAGAATAKAATKKRRQRTTEVSFIISVRCWEYAAKK